MDSESYKLSLTAVAHSICRKQQNFVGPLIPYNMKIQGITGECHIKWKGMWKSEIEDHGIRRPIKLQNTLSCKDVPYCLLSPQHWGQQSANHLRKSARLAIRTWNLVWDNSKM